MKKFERGVFCEGYPGLRLTNLDRLSEPIRAIDWHAPLEPTELPQALRALKSVLVGRQLKLDAVVFGLPGERYDSPSIAKQNVGFAAPDAERRSERFRYATELLKAVTDELLPGLFYRGVVTLKGHFGAFEKDEGADYAHLRAGLKALSKRLEAHHALLLAETGCEPAEAIIELVADVGSKQLGCNWDTANLQLWNAPDDNFAYAERLAAAGLLRGVHVKGGAKPPAGARDQWGTEVSPTEELIRRALTLLKSASCFDGPVTVERELFLGDQRETQEEKALGLSQTLRLINKVDDELVAAA